MAGRGRPTGGRTGEPGRKLAVGKASADAGGEGIERDRPLAPTNQRHSRRSRLRGRLHGDLVDPGGSSTSGLLEQV
jgi:hypothetical protein